MSQNDKGLSKRLLTLKTVSPMGGVTEYDALSTPQLLAQTKNGIISITLHLYPLPPTHAGRLNFRTYASVLENLLVSDCCFHPTAAPLQSLCAFYLHCLAHHRRHQSRSLS